jgi:hypothetical protein
VADQVERRGHHDLIEATVENVVEFAERARALQVHAARGLSGEERLGAVRRGDVE